jgi:pimeloyl-ACP methyl ester carboxylesterase
MNAAATPSARAQLERLATAYGIPYRAGSPPTPHRFRTREGVTLSFLDWAGKGAPVLFLHGGSLTAHTWDLVCLALSDRLRCVAIDLRGHGESEWADDYRIDAHVMDVGAAVAHFGWNSVHLVGMSLGAVIAAHYAASGHARIASLTMVDTGPAPDFEATAEMRRFLAQPIAHLTLEKLTEAAVKQAARGQRDKILYRYMHMTRVAPDGRLAWRHDQQRRRPADYAHVLNKIEDLPALAPAVPCKALIVRGGRSRIITDEKVAAFAARFRDGRWITIPDAGHNVQEDNPVALARALRAFLPSSPPLQ